MKYHRLLKKIKEYLDIGDLKKEKQRDALKELLKEMSKKEKSLRQKLETENDKQEREKLNKRIAVLHAQREKGVKLLKSLGEDDIDCG